MSNPHEFDDFESTVLGSRHSAGAEAADDFDDTVLGSRQTPDASVAADDGVAPDDSTVISYRNAPSDETVVSNRNAVDDSTVISFRNAPVDETVVGARRAAVPTDRTHAVPRRRTEQAPVDVGGPRVAKTPDTRILKTPYRPRETAAAPVFRTQEAPKPLQHAADGVKAAHQLRRKSRRGLAVIITVTSVIVVAALAGIGMLLFTLFA